MVTKVQRIFFFAVFLCLALRCSAQDSITVNDAKVIKARSEITIERYLNNLLNTISYTGAESTDIKGLIKQSVEDNDKRIFLNDQIAIAEGGRGKWPLAVRDRSGDLRSALPGGWPLAGRDAQERTRRLRR